MIQVIFLFNFKRWDSFPGFAFVSLSVKNCDGWWKNFDINGQTSFTNTLDNLVLTICDSLPNPNINLPISLIPTGLDCEYNFITDAENYLVLVDNSPSLIFPGENYSNCAKKICRFSLRDTSYNLIADQFIPVGISENQAPCSFSYDIFPLNTSDYGVNINISPNGINNPIFSVTDIGNPITDLNNSITYLSSSGDHEICITSSIENTCQIEVCSIISLLPNEFLCSAFFSLEDNMLSPIFFGVEDPYFTPVNSDSMKVTLNGYSRTYGTISSVYVPLNKVTGNEVCLTMYRGDCSQESCQILDGPSLAVPENCIVETEVYLYGVRRKKLYAAVFPNVVANSFSWDFGDGNYSNSPVTTHTYSQSGTYIVSLTTVFDQCTAITYDTVLVDLDSECIEDFEVYKFSENRAVFVNQYLDELAQYVPFNVDWIAQNENIGNGSSINHQFSEASQYEVCMQYNIPNNCEGNICKVVDFSFDTLKINYNMVGFDSISDFSDSKIVLFGFQTNLETNEIFNENFQLGFSVIDTFSVNMSGSGTIDSLFYGYYGLKFIPGSLLNDTTILPSYSLNSIIWDQMYVYGQNYQYNQNVNVSFEKRTLTDNLGTGLVIGNVNYGPFKLSRDENPLQGANLILMHKNNPVRFLALDGNTNFQLSNLSNGVYTLMLDLPGYNTSTANFVISDENQTANVSLNYDAIAFDDFTPTSIESQQINEVVLYPNPTNERLCLSNVSGNGTLKITDISGKNVSSPQFQMTENTLSIDVSAIQAGIYFLTYSNNKEGKVFKKFIKN